MCEKESEIKMNRFIFDVILAIKLKDLKKILRKYKEVHSKECLLKCFEHFYSTIGESLSILRQTITLAYSFVMASELPPDLRTDLCC